ncbi:helix-turn-helix domain containing protein [Streptomyces sp. 71268]|uniref:TetR/AcrR family transcriptional regulator n=1 Tax=Streptomyces sp. 71268 TaxID=3002640 RepID=UPI0023F62CA3|nr:TetR/AcrR family transcriptional regulator [Streptomyces sp. 71268]WEV27794.1 helix-turn-helix domain containing protein [Streptomyces sp. 71268]
MPSTPASSASPAPHGRTGRPPLTSRAQILEAARRLIDRDGWEKLTLRRLAAETGIGTTTIYHHMRGKDDLLVLLLNQYLGQVERPEPPADPRDRIVATALAGHDVLAAWPWAAEVVTADGFVGLLDESALWMVEDIVSGAHDYGCTPEQSVHIFRSIWYYTVGEILVRARSPHRLVDRELPAFRDSFDADRAPHLAAVSDRWAEFAARDTYPRGLRAFVDGLLAQTTAEIPGEGG